MGGRGWVGWEKVAGRLAEPPRVYYDEEIAMTLGWFASAGPADLNYGHHARRAVAVVRLQGPPPKWRRRHPRHRPPAMQRTARHTDQQGSPETIGNYRKL